MKSIAVEDDVKADFDKLKSFVEKRVSEGSKVAPSFSQSQFLSILLTTYRAHALKVIEA